MSSLVSSAAGQAIKTSMTSIGTSLTTGATAAWGAVKAGATAAWGGITSAGSALASGAGQLIAAIPGWGWAIAGVLALSTMLGGARSFDEIMEEDIKKSLFGSQMAGEAIGIGGKTGFDGGNSAVLGANYGITGSGLIAQFMADGGENGNVGYFTGAQAQLDEFAKVAEAAGFKARVSGGVLEAISMDKTTEELRALWVGFNDGLEEAIAYSAVFKTATENNLISPTNLFFENFATGFAQSPFEARDSMLQIDSAFDDMVKGGMSKTDALFQSISDHYGIAIEDAQYFVDKSGVAADQWVAHFSGASGDALAAILDFDAEGRTAFEKLGSTAISTASDIAGGFSSELTGFLGRIDMGKFRIPNVSFNGNISGDITPTQTVPSAPEKIPFLGDYNTGGTFIVPSTGRGTGDQPFGIGLAAGERVTVEPRGGSNRATTTGNDDDLMDAIYQLVDAVNRNTQTSRRVKGVERAS